MAQQKYSITPEQFLREVGVEFKTKMNWLSVKTCPFCGGGDRGDILSFTMHKVDGNYVCKRTKCDARGTFWGLMLYFNYDPKKYVISDDRQQTKTRERFTYKSRK